MSLEYQPEFDGTTVLCRVCGDKASGFHYGVHSCEGCKGFFRRSIQQKIQYRPCTKNQQCSILRINRNRCQYCRLKKCIAVGMSRDAVRFGRVPKREKAKILAAMQKVNANSQEKALGAELDDEYKMMTIIVKAHEDTCSYTREKIPELIERAKNKVLPPYNSKMGCPLNPYPQIINGDFVRFSERFAPSIQGIVEFAKQIPGFRHLPQDDQVTLLKAGVFEVLLVRLACMFDTQANALICITGQVLNRDSINVASHAKFLLDSMFDFSERLNSMRLTDAEIALFCGVVIISADRPGLRNKELVTRMQQKMIEILRKNLAATHPDDIGAFNELMKKIPDLRTLNTLHSEKILTQRVEYANQAASTVGGVIENLADTSVHQLREANSYEMSMNNSNPHDIWSQYALVAHPPYLPLEEDLKDLRSTSPGQQSQHSGSSSTGSEWSTTDKDEHDLVGSPRSIARSLSPEDVKSPLRTSSFSNSRSYMTEEAWPSDANIIDYHHVLPKRAVENNGSDHGSSSGDEGCYVDSPIKAALYAKLNRVDSPTDSGIESGKEHGPSTTPPTISICSSPRSSTEDKLKDVMETDKHDSIEDMPVLKRALQAPPIMQPSMLMDEAYRHHKKFRAARREAGSPSSPSQLSLASTHSTLARTLEQAPRYLSEQQLKRTDLIHNIIMQKETLPGKQTHSLSHHQQTLTQSHHADTQPSMQNNSYPYNSVPNSSPISPSNATYVASNAQTHKNNLLVYQNGYSVPQSGNGQQQTYTQATWSYGQQQSSTVQVQYEPSHMSMNSHQNASSTPVVNSSRSGSPRMLFNRASPTSPLVINGVGQCPSSVPSSGCTTNFRLIQSEAKFSGESSSQPLNLSKKIFTPPLLKMES